MFDFRHALRGWRAIVAILVVALGAAAVVLAFTVLRQPKACARCPNIIVFETDDQTVADMQSLPRARALIGRQGVTFDNSFVNFSDCCPSRATFLTGQYVHNHDVLSNEPPDGGFDKLRSDETLPVWLQRAGYHTVFIGKYLNGYGRSDRELVPPGWDDWNAALDSFTGKEFRPAYYRTLYNRNGKLLRLPAGLYRTDADARTARAFIRRRARSSQPFFMWLAFLAPHGGIPIEPDDPSGPYKRYRTPALAPRDRNRLRNLPLPRPPNFNEADISDKPPQAQTEHLDRGRIAALQELFQQRRESLLAVDDAVASIVATLRRTGQLDNTLIIFTSDNGYTLGEHRIAPSQQWIYEPAIRVPLLMRGPGIPRDQHRSQLVINADLAPTILQAAHAKATITMDGLSLLPLVEDPDRVYARDLLIEVSKHFKRKALVGVRTPRYVFAEYRSGARELYDLRRDPWELTNRAEDGRYAGIQGRLQRVLDRLRDCEGASCQSLPR